MQGFIFLIGLLTVSVYLDYRVQRIPNALTLGGAVAGCLFALYGGSNGVTLLDACAGFGVGLALFLPLYALGKMGAGDVKMLAMVGTFLGPLDVFWAGLYALLAGGALALAWLVVSCGLREMLYHVLGSWVSIRAGGGSAIHAEPASDSPLQAKMPYAAAIAVGAMVAATVQLS